MKFKRALITGGAGFIGSFFCDRLYKEGIYFTVIDNLFRGKLENISALLNSENKFINLDLIYSKSIDQVAQVLIKEQPDLIIHYAAINGTEYFYDFPAKVIEVNSIGTYNTLQAIKKARKKGFDKKALFVFASTSEVYGEPFKLPTTENDITYSRIFLDRDSYAIAKLASEFFTRLFCKELNLNWIILRIFNVYGPRMISSKYGQVIPEFINRLKKGEYPLRIIGNGQQTRSFCYIDDHIELTWRLICNEYSYNDVYNIGNPYEIKILDLAKTIMKKIGLKPNFTFTEGRKGDHKRRKPDISKILDVVGLYNFISLEKGIDNLFPP